MGYLDGFLVTAAAAPSVRRQAGHDRVLGWPRRQEGQSHRPTSTTTTRSPSPSGCTADMSSTATRTAWRSASAASCAPACARRSASTCAAPTTIQTNPTSPGERFGFVYEINYLRCIHCDLCVEACPTEAITETKLFEFSFTNRQDADLHQGRAARRRRRASRSSCPGRTGVTARTPTRRVDARHVAVRRRHLPRRRSAGAASCGYGVAAASRSRAARRGATRLMEHARLRPRRRRWSSPARSGSIMRAQPGACRARAGAHAVRGRRARSSPWRPTSSRLCR